MRDQHDALATAPPTHATAWDRLPEESDRDWGLFVLYRDMHPSVRSIAKAHALYQQQKAESDPALDPETVKATLVLQYRAPGWVEKLSSKYHWVSRVRAYDEWKDRDQLERLQSTRVRSLVETATIGRELREKALQALEHLRVVAFETVLGEDGEPTTIAISTLSPNAIVQLAKAGTDLERLAVGLQQASGGGVNVQIANIMNPGGPGGHIPIPGSDTDLMRKVLEVAEARGVIVEGTVNDNGATQPSSPGERASTSPEDG